MSVYFKIIRNEDTQRYEYHVSNVRQEVVDRMALSKAVGFNAKTAADLVLVWHDDARERGFIPVRDVEASRAAHSVAYADC